MTQRGRQYSGPFSLVAIGILVLAAALDYWPSSIELQWRTLEAARIEAKQTEKPIFIDISTAWCAPCRQMDRSVFPDDSVRLLLNERFVPVRVDGDDTLSGRSVKQRYGINAYPTFLVVTAGGGLLREEIGFMPRSEMLRFLRAPMNSLIAKWVSLIQARAVAMVQKRRILAVVLRNEYMTGIVNKHFDSEAVLKLIDSLYVPTVVIQSRDSAEAQGLGYADFPLSDGSRGSTSVQALVVVLDAELHELHRFLLSPSVVNRDSTLVLSGLLYALEANRQKTHVK